MNGPETRGQPAASPASGPAVELTRALTPAERRFEAWRRTIGYFAGPLAFLLVWFAPLALPADAHKLAAIMAFVVVWWVTEAIPISGTALIGASLTVVTGISEATETFAPFAAPVIFLFIGGFMIGRAVAVHHVHVRVAHLLLSSRLVAGRTARAPLAIGLLTLFISGWISGTATTAMMAPLAMGVLAAIGTRGAAGGRLYGRRMMLTTAYAASVGSNLTPVGAPSNLVALGFLDQTVGVRVDFFHWMVIGIPATIVMAVTLFSVMRWMFPDLVSAQAEDEAASSDEWRKPPAEPWTPGQRNSLIVFAVAAVLWITPGVVALVTSTGSQIAQLLGERLDTGTVAILAASLLFILPINWAERRFTLDWTEASRIDWGTILLFGGGLSLGRLMFTTGLAETLGRALIDLSGAQGVWGVTAMAIAATILMSQLTSNTATAAMLTPVVLSICVAAGINPVPPGLGVAFGTGMPFLLPISTPPNAIVYGTGLIPITAMLKAGVILSVVGFIVVFVALRIFCPLLGFA